MRSLKTKMGDYEIRYVEDGQLTVRHASVDRLRTELIWLDAGSFPPSPIEIVDSRERRREWFVDATDALRELFPQGHEQEGAGDG
jgi:hypothetical protein